MPNDILKIEVSELFPYVNANDDNTDQRFIYKLESLLREMAKSEPPKNTIHLEKLQEEHKKTITVLKSFSSSNTAMLFNDFRYFVKDLDGGKWTITKDHIEKLIQLTKDKKYDEVREIVYALGYRSYIAALVLHEIEEKIFKGQIASLAVIHEEIVKDFDKIIQKTRVRAIFN